ncbi:MAG: MoaD/ThiS family protein [Hyphomicrobiales bacterium]
MNVTIQCFGVFRSFGDRIALSVEKGTTVCELRGLLRDKLTQLDSSFDNSGLIKNSHFATETEILADSAPLEEAMNIVIIPPVSGG